MTETTKDIADLREVAGTGETSDWMTWPKVDLAKLERVLDQLEAERQQREAVEAAALAMRDDMRVAREELAVLLGTQEPVGLIKRKTPLLSDGAFRYSFISDVNLPLDTELFTRQPKPVVVLPKSHYVAGCADKFMSEREVKKALKSAGIVVKDGE